MNTSSTATTGLLDLLWSTDPTSQLAIGLVISAFLAAVAFVYVPLGIRLWRVRSLATAVSMAAGDHDTPSAGQRTEVSTTFAESPLEAEFSLFLSRWKAALTDGHEERSPVRFLDVLEEHPLLPAGARRALLPALPSVFLALGLLGTFVGLGLALSGDAFSGARGATEVDVATLTGQVGLSLRAALWGIAISIVAGVAGRLIDGAFEGIGMHLDRSVQRCFPLVSSSELTSFGQRAQHEALVGLGSELTRFTTDLTERLDRGLQRIERSTANAASLISEEQRSGVQGVVRDLALQVRQGVDEHLSALQSALERATDHQDTVTGGIAAAFNQMADQSEAHARVTQNLDAAASTVEAAAGSFHQTVVDFQPVLGQLRETGSALEATSSRIESTHGVVTQAAEEVRISLQHAAAAVGEQRDFVDVSLGEIRATLDALSSGLGENLNKALRSVDDVLGQTVGRLRETIGESNDTIERMAVPMRAAEGTARELHSALERARSEMTGLSEWLGQALKPVRASLTQLDERTSDVARAMANFGDHALGMDKTMDALRADLREEGRKFRASAADLSRRLGGAADALSQHELTSSSGEVRAARTSAPWPPLAPRPSKGPSTPPMGPASESRRPGSADPVSPGSTEVESHPISREALRHSGSTLGERGDPPAAASSQPTMPPATRSPAATTSTTLPPFKLDRAPSPDESGDDELDAQAAADAPPRASGFDWQRSTSGSLRAGGDPSESFAGRHLGPDPYARREQANANSSRGADRGRPLAADLPPEATLEDRADELSLSGLLGAHGGGDTPLPPPVDGSSPAKTSPPSSEDEPER